MRLYTPPRDEVGFGHDHHGDPKQQSSCPTRAPGIPASPARLVRLSVVVRPIKAGRCGVLGGQRQSAVMGSDTLPTAQPRRAQTAAQPASSQWGGGAGREDLMETITTATKGGPRDAQATVRGVWALITEWPYQGITHVPSGLSVCGSCIGRLCELHETAFRAIAGEHPSFMEDAEFGAASTIDAEMIDACTGELHTTLRRSCGRGDEPAPPPTPAKREEARMKNLILEHDRELARLADYDSIAEAMGGGGPATIRNALAQSVNDAAAVESLEAENARLRGLVREREKVVGLRRRQPDPAFEPGTLARYCFMGCHNAPKRGGHGPWDGYVCKGESTLTTAWVSRWTAKGKLLDGAPDCPCRVTIKFDYQQAGDLGEEPGR